MSIPEIHLTSNVDQLTIIFGVSITVAKIIFRRLRNIKPCASRTLCGVDLLNGALVAPFGALSMSVFLPAVMADLQATNAAILSLAGAIGVIFVVGELLS